MRGCIERKREGHELPAAQWHAIVEAFVSGAVDEAQMAALCMACVWRGMSLDEVVALTQAMVDSGAVITFEHGRSVVDKHSSGGVGDIVSIAAIPIAAAAGAHVAKISGRALGHTGGTIDKLEAIPGVRTDLNADAFVRQVEAIGCAIAAQTEAMVPADKRLYRLRDRTGTVPAPGLLASSIVSKKIAGGAHAFVFDVKTGAASFVPPLALANELAGLLVQLAHRFGRRARALVSDMSQPLGRAIGTGIEAIEARDLLRGHSKGRARELVLDVAGAMLEEAGVANAAVAAHTALESGAAYAKMLQLVRAQHGDADAFEAMETHEPLQFCSPRSGYVQSIERRAIGECRAPSLGARSPGRPARLRADRRFSHARGAALRSVRAEPRPSSESSFRVYDRR